MLANGGLIKTNKRLKDLCTMFLANPGTIVTDLDTHGLVRRSSINNDAALRVAQRIAQEILHDTLKLAPIGR